MLQIEKNKQALEILKSIALCGEYSAQAIMLIRHNSDEYLRRTIRDLQKERYISKVGTGQAKRLALLQKGIETLKDICPEAAEHYNELMKSHHGDKAHILRELRLSEVRQLMTLADVQTMPINKPKLLNIHTTDQHPSADSCTRLPYAESQHDIGKANLNHPADTCTRLSIAESQTFFMIQKK